MAVFDVVTVVDNDGLAEPVTDGVGLVVKEGVAEPDSEGVGLADAEGVGELQTVSVVVVHVVATVPCPGLEPQVEHVSHVVLPASFW